MNIKKFEIKFISQYKQYSTVSDTYWYTCCTVNIITCYMYKYDQL